MKKKGVLLVLSLILVSLVILSFIFLVSLSGVSATTVSCSGNGIDMHCINNGGIESFECWGLSNDQHGCGLGSCLVSCSSYTTVNNNIYCTYNPTICKSIFECDDNGPCNDACNYVLGSCCNNSCATTSCGSTNACGNLCTTGCCTPTRVCLKYYEGQCGTALSDGYSPVLNCGCVNGAKSSGAVGILASPQYCSTFNPDNTCNSTITVTGTSGVSYSVFIYTGSEVSSKSVFACGIGTFNSTATWIPRGSNFTFMVYNVSGGNCTVPRGGNLVNITVYGSSASCSTSTSGVTGTCVLNNAAFLTAASWRNNTNLNNSLTSLGLGQNASLFVNGTSLSGLKINYTIYNASSNLAVYNVTHVVINSVNDSISWQPSAAGTYYFNATLNSTGQKIKSGNITVYTSTFNPACSWAKYNGTITSLPANATWNDNGQNGHFNQIYDGVNYIPLSVNATFNNTIDTCHFNCSVNFTWDSTHLKCNPIPKFINYCWDYKDSTNCSNYNPNVAAKTIQNGQSICGSSQVFGSDTCVAVCSCVWDSVKNNCTSAAINWTVPSQPSKICGSVSPFCRLNFSIDNSGCLNDLDTLTISQTATWVGTGTPVNCSNAVRTFVCPASYKVDFTTNLGIILLVISVILIYFLSSNKFTRR